MNLSELTSFIPAEITLITTIKMLGIGIAVIFTASLLLRLFFGRQSAINKAISASIGVLCIYILTIIIYTFSPGNLDSFLVPLPFVKFSKSYLYLMSFADSGFDLICSQILSTLILVLLYNLADSVLPNNESTSAISWFLLRYIAIVASMAIHYFLSKLTYAFLPDLLVSYGPIILLLCLFASITMGVVGFILRLILIVVNPVLGLLITFSFSNRFGKQLSKATLSTVILAAIVAVLHRFGYSIISISVSSLISYIPLLAALMALWYFIGRKL